MEYLDGETLATWLTRGALPIDQVLRYGSEIASALAAAHRQSVVHRDLKPGNIMITRAAARLLDFGLAKPALVAAMAVDVTASAPITAWGTLVGTYPNMSPEPVEGREVDARSDIFALGAVLYEMATGTGPSTDRRRRASSRRSSSATRPLSPRGSPSPPPRSTTSSAAAWRKIPRIAGRPRTT